MQSQKLFYCIYFQVNIINANFCRCKTFVMNQGVIKLNTLSQRYLIASLILYFKKEGLKVFYYKGRASADC